MKFIDNRNEVLLVFIHQYLKFKKKKKIKISHRGKVQTNLTLISIFHVGLYKALKYHTIYKSVIFI